VIVVAIMVAIVIAVVVVHVAALANFMELPTPLLGLLATLAVLVDRLFQVLLGLVDVAAASVVAVGAGGDGRSRQ
jgi:hypothetical protein